MTEWIESVGLENHVIMKVTYSVMADMAPHVQARMESHPSRYWIRLEHEKAMLYMFTDSIELAFREMASGATFIHIYDCLIDRGV